jgi:hypothetical protein
MRHVQGSYECAAQAASQAGTPKEQDDGHHHRDS